MSNLINDLDSLFEYLIFWGKSSSKLAAEPPHPS